MFRGRENQHPELAVKVLRQVAESVASEAKLEKTPTREQRSLSIVLAPAQGSVGAPIGSSGDDA
jgi:translation initiation factor IF-3